MAWKRVWKVFERLGLRVTVGPGANQGTWGDQVPRRPSAIRPGKQQLASPSPGYATEQSLPAGGREEGHQTAERKAPGGQEDIEDAQADRADDTMDNLLDKLVEFLSLLLQDVWIVSGLRQVTEQAKLVWEKDCYFMAYDKVMEWDDDHRRRDLYGTPELLLHRRMWDIVTRDKAGRAKEQSFSEWCRRVAVAALHSETTSTATGDVAADSTATDHAESSAPFRALAEDILTHDLTEAQAKDPVYKLRKGKALKTKQRSTINCILRKNLGDARVCHFIFNHGIPTLLEVHPRRKNTQ